MENIAKISIETTSRSGDTVGTNCQLMGDSYGSSITIYRFGR